MCNCHVQEMSCAVIRRHLWLAAVTAVLVALTTHQAEADAGWPPLVPSGGMAAYECCCLDNPTCGGCFRCRQNVYTCYCDTCSCYSVDRSRPSTGSVLQDDNRSRINDGKSSGFHGRLDSLSPARYVVA